MGKIMLEGLELYAYHGVHPEERENGQIYLVQLTLETQLDVAGATDLLEHTIDYSEVYRRIKEAMAIPSNLLEHVAKRILDSLKIHFPEIERSEIKITKPHPPIEGKIGGVSVILEQLH